MTKKQFKQLIRECLEEEKGITNKDVGYRMPQTHQSRWNDLKSLTMGNLQSLLNKYSKQYSEMLKGETNRDEIKRVLDLCWMYNAEIKRRKFYINKKP
jgi:hypothetical protein